MQKELFQYSGIVLVTMVFMSIIMIPLILKKRKRLKRVLAARNRHKSTIDDDEFEAFFD
jgi:Tfp pilus assembly protein PilV